MDESVLQDGGYASRKFWMGIITMALIVGSAVAEHWMPSIQPNYATLVGGLVGCYALFLGGNVAAKQVLAKNLVAKNIGATEAKTSFRTPPPENPTPAVW